MSRDIIDNIDAKGKEYSCVRVTIGNPIKCKS